MDTLTDREMLTARAEFYLCLSRAFLTPSSDGAFSALREALADDLEELAVLLNYPASSAIAGYRLSISRVGSPLELLQIYSALFLTAPRNAHINTAVYIDGSVNGGSVAAMEDEYHRLGLARSDSLRDLSDHVAVQLEFVATLFAQASIDPEAVSTQGEVNDPETAARNFLDYYVRRWVGPWIGHLDETTVQNGLAANPYADLARILEIAVKTDGLPVPMPKAETRQCAAMRKARQERAAHGIDEEDIAIISARLRAAGLSTEHLALRQAMLEQGTRTTL